MCLFLKWCSIVLFLSLVPNILGFSKKVGNVTRYDANYSELLFFEIDDKDEVIVSFPQAVTSNSYRITAYSPNSVIDFPILVVVRQERRVTSWQIPLLVHASEAIQEYRNTSRILCYDDNTSLQKHYKGRFASSFATSRHFTVSLSTSSWYKTKIYLQADHVKEFVIRNRQKYEVRISPSEPIFYSYNFRNNSVGMNDVRTVLLLVHSDDDVCFTVSIQPKVCPVRDLNDDITYQGEYQTVNTKGGLTISKSKYPDGFYVVFVSKGDNFDCSQQSSLLPSPSVTRIVSIEQKSLISFELRDNLTPKQYLLGIFVTLFVNLLAAFILFNLTYLFYYYGRYKDIEPIAEPDCRMLQPLSIDEIDSYFEKTELKVSDFVRKGDNNNSKALNYFWHITNIGIFYGIPVVQLMISYQRTVDTSGNLDMCYHNFQCSHPLYFTDFNHIFSNIGYVIFGFLFLLITYFRNKKIRNFPNCGVPKLHGLFYSMGFALIFEGILSACYHICPNQMNFQFDTSFMYVMAVLIMIKLYQNRHPDINASAYSTFGVLGVAVFVAMFGILYNSTIIMMIFVATYIALCFYLAFEIYFFGHVLRGLHLLYYALKNGESFKRVIKPVRIGRFVLLLIANLANFAIAITGMVLYPKHVDFGTFLLGILMLNAIIYAMFYMTMKMVLKERICWEAMLYGILSMVLWGAGGYFFLSGVTQWSVTPAESRQLNKECIIMGFYDTHDVWHLISAPALFFSFMFLLVLDDDLFNIPQTDIYAF